MKTIIQDVEKEFRNRYGDEYLLIKSPGRVNLIGEHTDYNEGFVLPAAVDKCIILAISKNDSGQFRFFAIDKSESYKADASEEVKVSDLGWPNYLLGVVDELRKRGDQIDGFDCVFSGNVPIGAGMSSSAALENGVVFGLNRLFGLKIDEVDMVKIAQRAENNFVGVQCGIMDQFVSMMGEEEHVLQLDCRSLEYELYPFKRDDLRIVLCDTKVRRELATSEYNKRRQECEEGVAILQKHDESIQSLRDVSSDLLEEHKDEMPPVVYKRCRYVIDENQRLLDACADLKNDDYASFGERMLGSHVGLRDQYEVSCKELDILVEAAQKIDGVFGSRMMGGGFGGCTINIVKEEAIDRFKRKIMEEYQEKTGITPEIYLTKVSGGTQFINES